MAMSGGRGQQPQAEQCWFPGWAAEQSTRPAAGSRRPLWRGRSPPSPDHPRPGQRNNAACGALWVPRSEVGEWRAFTTGIDPGPGRRLSGHPPRIQAWPA